MTRFAFVLIASVMASGAVCAQEAVKVGVDYKTALSACSADWKVFQKEHKAGGRDQWQMFRADCVAKKGYTGKASNKIADRISNEDFAKLLKQ